MPNLKKMSFSNHDLKKYLEFKLQNYMDNVYIVECVPIELVPKDWERGLQRPDIPILDNDIQNYMDNAFSQFWTDC